MAAGSSVFDMVGAALSDPGPGGSSQTSDTGSTSTESTTADAGTGSTETTEAADTTGTTDEALGATSVTDADTTVADQGTETEENPYATDPNEELPKAQLDAVLATPRGKEIYQGYKTIREVSKPVQEGGIGHTPSVGQIKEYWQASQGMNLMNHHLNSGDANGINQFLGFVFNPQRGEGPQQLASNLAASLASTNPDAYVAASVPFVTNYSNALWDRWRDEPDGPNKDSMFRAAQILHKDLTGKWKSLKELGIHDPNQPQTQGPDPYAEERQALEQERAEIEQSRAQDRQAFQQRWDSGAATAIGTEVVSELDKALAPLKTMYTNSPRVYAALRKEFHDIVVSGVKASAGLWDNYQIQLAQGRNRGTQEAMQQVAKEYLRIATPIIRSNLSKFLKEAGAVVKTNSDARHAELRSIDQRKGVGPGGGAALTPGSGETMQRKPGETNQDFVLRQLRA